MTYTALLLSLFVSWATSTHGREFTDANLETVFHAKKEKTILYTWSPHMNLSVLGLDELIKYAHNNKYHLVVVLDPNCNKELAHEIAGKHKWPDEYLQTIQSPELLKKGVRVHYPSYLLVQNGGFVSPMTPGYKNKEELDRITRTYFK